MLSSLLGSNTLNDTAKEYHINIAPADNQTAVMFHEETPFGGRQANSSWTMSWPDSPPYEYMRIMGERLNKYDWFRTSFCIKGKQPIRIYNKVKTMTWKGSGATVNLPGRKDVDEYNSLAELHNASFTGHFWNETSGWLHIRIVSEHVLSEAGTGVDNFGDPVQFDAYPEWVLRFDIHFIRCVVTDILLYVTN